ncbi:MAG: DUF2284 domain-containing protein [Planctomycetota bacterium]|jgi:predicted metal-binding protein
MARKGTRGRKRPAAAALATKALELGAKEAKVVGAASIVTAPWVRLKCRYGCDGYGSSLCCPPHSPAPEETRAVIDSYAKAILFEAGDRGTKEIAFDLERACFLAGYHKAFGYGAGPCMLCEECAFDEGCRHAREARPAMEACGIDVFATARANGFEIEVVRDRADPQHYFGVVLLE